MLVRGRTLVRIIHIYCIGIDRSHRCLHHHHRGSILAGRRGYCRGPLGPPRIVPLLGRIHPRCRHCRIGHPIVVYRETVLAGHGRRGRHFGGNGASGAPEQTLRQTFAP
jgi:hypothetical protein